MIQQFFFSARVLLLLCCDVLLYKCISRSTFLYVNTCHINNKLSVLNHSTKAINDRIQRTKYFQYFPIIKVILSATMKTKSFKKLFESSKFRLKRFCSELNLASIENDFLSHNHYSMYITKKKTRLNSCDFRCMPHIERQSFPSNFCYRHWRRLLHRHCLRQAEKYGTDS